jgi:hypothetical protein
MDSWHAIMIKGPLQEAPGKVWLTTGIKKRTGALISGSCCDLLFVLQ